MFFSIPYLSKIGSNFDKAYIYAVKKLEGGLQTFLPVLLLSLLAACGGGSEPSTEIQLPEPPVTTNPPPTNQEQQISLIHMNDLHANLLSHKEAFRTEGSAYITIANAGGIAKLAAKISEIRENNPNNILMNIGDTFHGSGEALFSNGNAIVDPVNALNIDIGVPGNWDFAYGPIITNARFGNLNNADVKRPNYPLLAANTTYRIPPQIQGNIVAERAVQTAFQFSAGDPFLPAIQIIERDGIKIGFIGLTSDIVERMHPLLAFNLEFTQGENDYLALIRMHAAKLKTQGAQAVMVMSELGIQKDWALANQLDANEIQVFFSAHTHEATEQALISASGTLVVEAGNDSYLGQLDLTFENGELSDMQWMLHTLGDSVPDNAQMLTMITQERSPFVVDNPNLSIPSVSIGNGQFNDLFPSPSNQTLTHGLDNLIHTTHLPLSRLHSLESDFNNFTTDLLRLTTLSDVAMTPGFRFGSLVIPSSESFNGGAEDYLWQSETPTLLNGEITAADIYRFFPAPYNVSQGTISVGALKSIIETNLDNVYSPSVFDQSGGWFDGFSGISLQVDLSSGLSQRVKSLTLVGETNEAEDNRMISVTGCSRPFDLEGETTLCSYRGFTNVAPLLNPASGEAYAIADYMIDQLLLGDIDFNSIKTRKDITDRSETPQWPESSFVQPLEGVQ